MSFSHRGVFGDEHPIWQCRLGTLLARATQFWGGELNMVGMQWVFCITGVMGICVDGFWEKGLFAFSGRKM